MLLYFRDFSSEEIKCGPAEHSDDIEIVDLTDTGFSWDNEDSVVSKLVCIGIVGIEDPVRDEVSDV